MNEKELVSILLQERVRLCALLWLMLKDSHATDDVFQDVVVKALQQRAQLESAQHLARWARTTARHRATDLLRQQQTRSRLLSEQTLSLIESHLDQQDRQAMDERIDALRQCLDQLPPRARRLLERRYTIGEKAVEIARTTGHSLESVYQRLSRLQRGLRRCVESRLGSCS